MRKQGGAYANNFIAVHLSEMPYGGVYAKAKRGRTGRPEEHGDR